MTIWPNDQQTPHAHKHSKVMKKVWKRYFLHYFQIFFLYCWPCKCMCKHAFAGQNTQHKSKSPPQIPPSQPPFSSSQIYYITSVIVPVVYFDQLSGAAAFLLISRLKSTKNEQKKRNFVYSSKLVDMQKKLVDSLRGYIEIVFFGLIYMFRPTFECCKHPKAGRNIQHVP